MGAQTVDLVRLGLALTMWAAAAWIAGSFVAAWVGWEKGREPVGWFIVAFFCSPLVALIALSAVPARHLTRIRAARSLRGKERPFLADPAVVAARFVNGVHQRKKVGA